MGRLEAPSRRSGGGRKVSVYRYMINDVDGRKVLNMQISLNALGGRVGTLVDIGAQSRIMSIKGIDDVLRNLDGTKT